MPERPRGTVTFLFTDVEGSTSLWAAHPDAMVAAYAWHDVHLHGATARHGGVIYKVVGDAIQAAFPTAPAAVAAALDAQRGLVTEDWAALGLPIRPRVRMALHAGAVDPDPTGDYRSPVLNRLGRLLGAGHGGQVLLSLAAAELARDGLPEGAALRDLGEHPLKDLYRPERVWQLAHPELPAAFPPLRTLERHRHNLPTQLTPLVGREREVAEVASLLQRSGIRLLTLTGPGGVGKTRLALQVAADLLDEFPDGAWFVDLSPLADPALVVSAAASVLGVREDAGRPLDQALTDFLREKRLMLVLDNCEHLLAAAPLVAALVGAAPGLQVLATSRERLALRGEHELVVPTLDLPDAARLPPAERLTQYAAVRLFVERAETARPGFAVSNENAPAVAEICHRLDGLPLAIELAAARIKLFGPDELLKRLGSRLGLLTGGARDLPARQRTLRDAIAWSYDLLNVDQRLLFRRLAVFAGGATLDAIAAVCVPAGDLDVLGVVAALVDQSLVRQGEAASETRFGMLETIREFALERLAASGEAEALVRAHAEWATALAEEAERHYFAAEQLVWRQRLEREQPNLRAAVGWALTHDAALALRLTAALGRFWTIRGQAAEGRDALTRALATGAEPAGTVRARAFNRLGDLALFTGDLPSARAHFDEALRLANSVGGAAEVAEANLGQANVAGMGGDIGASTAANEVALDLFRQLGIGWGVSACLGTFAVMSMIDGDLGRAEALASEALVADRQRGDAMTVATNLLLLSQVARNRGDTTAARARNEEALATFQDLDDPVGVANARSQLAVLAYDRGEYALAAELVGEALRWAWEAGVGDFIATGLGNVGIFAEAAGRADRAVRLIGAAEALAEALGMPLAPDAASQAVMDRHVPSARAALGEEAFAAGWAAGRALTRREAVAEALALADELAVGTNLALRA